MTTTQNRNIRRQPNGPGLIFRLYPSLINPLIARVSSTLAPRMKQSEGSVRGIQATRKLQLQALKMPKLPSRDKRGRAGATSRRTKVPTRKQTKPVRLVRASPADRRLRGLRFAQEMALGARWSFRKKGHRFSLQCGNKQC